MRLGFEEILQTLKASSKKNIEGRERLMKLKIGLAKGEIGRIKKDWRNTLATLTTFVL